MIALKFTIGDIQLTERETQCLAAMICGLSARETAKILNISVRTVGNYRENIKNKFGGMARSRIILNVLNNDFPLDEYIHAFSLEEFIL